MLIFNDYAKVASSTLVVTKTLIEIFLGCFLFFLNLAPHCMISMAESCFTQSHFIFVRAFGLHLLPWIGSVLGSGEAIGGQRRKWSLPRMKPCFLLSLIISGSSHSLQQSWSFHALLPPSCCTLHNSSKSTGTIVAIKSVLSDNSSSVFQILHVAKLDVRG